MIPFSGKFRTASLRQLSKSTPTNFAVRKPDAGTG
jgi:hypothetical protein